MVLELTRMCERGAQCGDSIVKDPRSQIAAHPGQEMKPARWAQAIFEVSRVGGGGGRGQWGEHLSP